MPPRSEKSSGSSRLRGSPSKGGGEQPGRDIRIWIGSIRKERLEWARPCEAHLAMEIIADHGRLVSFEIVEVNPVIDEHNRTADLAVELACSAFGKKIL